MTRIRPLHALLALLVLPGVAALQGCPTPILYPRGAAEAPAAAPVVPAAVPLPAIALTGRAEVYGQPFAGAAVAVYKLGGTEALGTATTAADGTFHVGLPAGQPAGAVYKVVARKDAQGLASMVQLPGAAAQRRVLEAPFVLLNVTTTFSYQVLAPRLEASGQATTGEPAQVAMRSFDTLVKAGSPLDTTPPSDPLVSALLGALQANGQSVLDPADLARFGDKASEVQQQVFRQVADEMATALRASLQQSGRVVDDHLLGSLVLGKVTVAPVLGDNSGSGGSGEAPARRPHRDEAVPSPAAGLTLGVPSPGALTPHVSPASWTYTFPRFSVGAAPAAVAIHPDDGCVWVTCLGGSGNTVNRITESTKVVETFTVGSQPKAIAISAVTGDVWVANASGNTVTRLSRTGGLLGTYDTPVEPIALAIDPDNGDVWIATGAGVVAVLDFQGNPSRTVPIGVPLAGIALDDEAGQVWVTSPSEDLVYRMALDGTGVVGFPVMGDSPQGVAVDPGRGRVWVANQDDDTVTLLTTGGILVNWTPLPSGGSPSMDAAPVAVAVSPDTGDAWVACGNGFAEQLSPSGDSLRRAGFDKGMRGIAVGGHRRVYIPNPLRNTVTRL